jgi:hypothetical protein
LVKKRRLDILQDQGHIAVILGNLAHPLGGIDQNGPDGRDKNHKNRSRLILLERHQGNRHPSQRRNHAQELEQGIEGSVDGGLETNRDPYRNAHKGRQGVPLGHPAQAGKGLPEQPLVKAAPIIEGIE